MGIRAELLARMTVRKTGSADFGGPSQDAILELLMQLTDGVDANEADIFWSDERSVASNTNDDLDLAGVLADAFGATVNSAEVVGLILINKPKTVGATPNTTSLTVGLGTNPMLGFLGGTLPTLGPIRPGGFVFLAAPGELGIGLSAAGVSDLLRIANSTGAAAVYQIGILARTTTG